MPAHDTGGMPAHDTGSCLQPPTRICIQEDLMSSFDPHLNGVGLFGPHRGHTFACHPERRAQSPHVSVYCCPQTERAAATHSTPPPPSPRHLTAGMSESRASHSKSADGRVLPSADQEALLEGVWASGHAAAGLLEEPMPCRTCNGYGSWFVPPTDWKVRPWQWCGDGGGGD
eukprot:358511-Chlamydomonas_euryale.AAC.4